MTRRTVEEERARFGVRRDALQQRKRIADAIRRVRFELGRREQRVDGDNFLQNGRNRADRVPQNGREIRHCFAFLRQLEQRRLALVGVRQIKHQRVNFGQVCRAHAHAKTVV